MDKVLGRVVATKVVRSAESLQLSQFRREARITAQLDHPNIVPVHDLGSNWFTMKRVEGITLTSMARVEPFGVAMLGKVIDVLLKVCDALAFAHDRGVVHRDLKPDNVMIGRFGQVYLMDWGIAQAGGVSEVPFAGTTSWMSPEQARGEVCDGRTDVWGVGALLYFTLCGGRPNQGDTAEARVQNVKAGQRPPSPTTLAPERAMPPELVRIATKCLEPVKEDRYPSILALADELREVLNGGWWFELRAFPADTEIIREGDQANTAYILVEGTCEVRQNGGPIAELGPGEIFGEAALLTGGTRTASVVALTDVVTRVITREALEAELGRERWLGPLVRGLAKRFYDLSLENMEKRY